MGHDLLNVLLELLLLSLELEVVAGSTLSLRVVWPTPVLAFGLGSLGVSVLEILVKMANKHCLSDQMAFGWQVHSKVKLNGRNVKLVRLGRLSLTWNQRFIASLLLTLLR